MTLLSPQAAAAVIGVGPARLRQMDADLEPIRIGRNRAYRADRVEFVAGYRAVSR